MTTEPSATTLPTTPERGFVRLARANLAAQTAEQIALAAAPIIAVVSLGATESDTGWLQTAQTLPFLLLSIPAGLLVERLQPRQVMAVAKALRALAMALVVVLLLSGQLSLLWLALLGFVAASATVAFTVAAPAFVVTAVLSLCAVCDSAFADEYGAGWLYLGRLRRRDDRWREPGRTRGCAAALWHGNLCRSGYGFAGVAPDGGDNCLAKCLARRIELFLVGRRSDRVGD